jgi:predicted enzyme involved in methoxymalonyl-ACP biosynthesis
MEQTNCDYCKKEFLARNIDRHHGGCRVFKRQQKQEMVAQFYKDLEERQRAERYAETALANDLQQSTPGLIHYIKHLEKEINSLKQQLVNYECPRCEES